MLEFTDKERKSTEKGSRGVSWIFLERSNSIDFSGGLRLGGDGNGSGQLLRVEEYSETKLKLVGIWGPI